MENNQQKWVNLTFVATALLLAYVLFVLSVKFSVILDFEGRVRSLDKILMAASAVIGLGSEHRSFLYRERRLHSCVGILSGARRRHRPVRDRASIIPDECRLGPHRPAMLVLGELGTIRLRQAHRFCAQLVESRIRHAAFYCGNAVP